MNINNINISKLMPKQKDDLLNLLLDFHNKLHNIVENNNNSDAI